MNLDKFAEEYPYLTNRRLMTILTERSIPFVVYQFMADPYDNILVIWLEDALVSISPDGYISIDNITIKQNIEIINKFILAEKEFIDMYRQNFIECQNEDISPSSFFNIFEEKKLEKSKMKIIIATQLKETAEYYESKPI